jgi:hypothetical protein
LVFAFIVRFIVAAGVTFIVINVMAPIIYDVWYGNLRDSITDTAYGLRLAGIGDIFFGNFLIMSFVVPGIIIIWGFVVAQRKRVVEQSV